MVAANDLRIGNTFLNVSDGLFDDGKIITLAQHHFYWAFETSVELETLLEPIPLSTEILKQCGFEYNSATYILNDVKVYFSLRNGLMLEEFYRSSSNTKIKGCEYLHQLQNLYFSLTGNELEIKLPITNS